MSGLCAGLALALAATACAAQTEPDNGDEQGLPLWEAGAGIGVLTAPAYLGSKVTRTYAAPWPYFVYRGETLKANREGVGIGVLEAYRAKLDLSFSGALPVRSAGTAREGMPDLPLAIETGAVLKLALVDEPGRHWSLRLPLRYASGVHRSGLQHIGWISDPTLRHIERVQLFGHGVDWGLDLSVKFQDRSFNNFYYQVLPSQVTSERPAYTSAGGYSGATINTGLFTRAGRLVLGAFVGFSDLAGARFAGSPLVQRSNNWYGGFAISWVFKESEQPAPMHKPAL